MNCHVMNYDGIHINLHWCDRTYLHVIQEYTHEFWRINVSGTGSICNNSGKFRWNCHEMNYMYGGIHINVYVIYEYTHEFWHINVCGTGSICGERDSNCGERGPGAKRPRPCGDTHSAAHGKKRRRRNIMRNNTWNDLREILQGKIREIIKEMIREIIREIIRERIREHPVSHEKEPYILRTSFQKSPVYSLRVRTRVLYVLYIWPQNTQKSPISVVYVAAKEHYIFSSCHQKSPVYSMCPQKSPMYTLCGRNRASYTP